MSIFKHQHPTGQTLLLSHIMYTTLLLTVLQISIVLLQALLYTLLQTLLSMLGS